MPIALISGITGQDGIYLSVLLLKKGYTVIGLVRSENSIPYNKFDYLGIKSHPMLSYEICDMTDITQVIKILSK